MSCPLLAAAVGLVKKLAAEFQQLEDYFFYEARFCWTKITLGYTKQHT
jgi:hypothetical protein